MLSQKRKRQQRYLPVGVDKCPFWHQNGGQKTAIVALGFRDEKQCWKVDFSSLGMKRIEFQILWTEFRFLDIFNIATFWNDRIYHAFKNSATEKLLLSRTLLWENQAILLSICQIKLISFILMFIVHLFVLLTFCQLNSASQLQLLDKSLPYKKRKTTTTLCIVLMKPCQRKRIIELWVGYCYNICNGYRWKCKI